MADQPEWLIPPFKDDDFCEVCGLVDAFPDVESFPDGPKEDWPEEVDEFMEGLERATREAFRVEKPNVLLLCEGSNNFKKALEDCWGPKGEIGTVRCTTNMADGIETLDPTKLTEGDLADVNIIHCNFPYLPGAVADTSEAVAKYIPEIAKSVCQVGTHGQRFRLGLFLNRPAAGENPIMYAPCHGEQIAAHIVKKSYEDDSQKCALLSVWPLLEKPYLQYRQMGYDDWIDCRVQNHFMLHEFVLVEKECMKEMNLDLELCQKLTENFITRCPDITGLDSYIRKNLSKPSIF
mmetsp:Transcript_67470/g.140996  ORF Transcript_67470/g.140996 Transcript_67470/m.140996 type:complete len:292 (-) Transcript_67470:339-1214(-)|eukprot:CAMPEP_0206526260 /NCGR_PEP_ID=MMETSP0325_2-20121206/615_1 /ASSEMBLY_ACC=CAM_ASM_000347 /TAXON_ID=2866 /ORGANISM="Crypthecodinium cohnii, Strain Seligo" /LENGTH=291 /DNA_ID=CAMNT_0054021381 /DNA_START=8 /DNA_END=883 /DNA_ORIENTATION=-